MGTLPLLRGRISLTEALKDDKDMIQELSYPKKRANFWCHLYQCRPQIEEVISQQLRILRSDFRLGDVKEWIHGSFNACLPIYITANSRTSELPQKGIIRFPLPYKVGEEMYPGNADEKLRCEAATYIWLQSDCSDIPVPRLLGFGFSGGQSFMELKNASFFSRVFWYIRNGFARVFGTSLVPYIPYRRRNLLDLGYLIIEHVNEGQMLSSSWKKHRSDLKRRANLFKGLSQIMLSLANRPLPRIASWTINDLGALSLTNRPLTHSLHQQENLGIPTEILRYQTYTSVEPYYLDLIACQDNHIRHQPNSIHSTEDGEAQLAALTSMRALLPKFTDRRGRDGPFVLALTDLHASNIFVDDDWKITKIIDLEWSCARPVEMISPPYWISGYNLDEIVSNMEEYSASQAQFIECFEKEEVTRYHSTECTQILRTRGEAGTFWYFRALDSPDALLDLFKDHVQPKFAGFSSQFDRAVTPLWDYGTAKFIDTKLVEQERYFDRLRGIFHNSVELRGSEEKEAS